MTKAQHVNRNDDYLLDLNGGVSPLVSDLLSFCEQAFLADRNEPRGKNPDNANWHRTLKIVVPVGSPSVWSGAPVLDMATELLTWLTDDDWQIRFVEVDREPQEAQGQLDIDPVERTAMLFSGGLDATAGAALTLPETPLLGVGVVTNPVMGGYQRRARKALAQLGDIRYSPVLFSVASGEPATTNRRAGREGLCSSE